MEHLVMNVSEPVVLPVKRVVQENSRAKTLFFSSGFGMSVRPPASPDLDLSRFNPGQFVMVWIPRMDEKPFTISYLNEEEFGITVVRRGPFSTALNEAKPGDAFGFRGPYGRGFSEPVDEAGTLLVAGGCGLATLAVMAEDFPEAHVIQGARTASELFFTHRVSIMSLCTEDGSCGYRGMASDLLRQYLGERDYSRVYACGPEKMLAKVFDICEQFEVPCELSLERYIKCGLGLCGQCDCDGMLVCRDGPVFDGEQLRKMPSFGRFARVSTGRRVSIDEYNSCRMEGPQFEE